MKLNIKYIVRPAEIEDIDQISALLKHYSDQRLLLEKTKDSLYRQIRGFRVAVAQDLTQNYYEIVGSAHLDIFTENLAEVKSLAVAPDFQGLGIGASLVKDCEKEARNISIKKVFALTYQVEFFNKIGYKLIDINSLPEKVFKECVICPFYGKCNENAFIKDLS